MLGHRDAELVDDGLACDAAMGGEPQHVAGVVIEPREDLAVGPVGEERVGGVRLPTLVGEVGFEARIGLRGRFSGAGVMSPWRRRSDGRCRTPADVMVMLEVPADRVGAGVETLATGPCAAPDQRNVAYWSRSVTSSGDVIRGSNAASPSTR